MTVKEIADLCGVDEHTVIRWAHKAAEKASPIAHLFSTETITPEEKRIAESIKTKLKQSGDDNIYLDNGQKGDNRNDLAVIERDNKQWINARDLHEHLEVGRFFANWIKGRIKECSFVEGKDFLLNLANRPNGNLDFPNSGNQDQDENGNLDLPNLANQDQSGKEFSPNLGNRSDGKLDSPNLVNQDQDGFEEDSEFLPNLAKTSPKGGRPAIDYLLSVSTAIQIAAMESNSPKSQEILRLLSKMGEAWNTPEMVKQRALQMGFVDPNDISLRLDRIENAISQLAMDFKSQFPRQKAIEYRPLTSDLDEAIHQFYQEHIIFSFQHLSKFSAKRIAVWFAFNGITGKKYKKADFYERFHFLYPLHPEIKIKGVIYFDGITLKDVEQWKY